MAIKVLQGTDYAVSHSDAIKMRGKNKTLTEEYVKLDGAVSQTKIQDLKTIKGFQFSANNQTTALYSTGLNLVKGKRYRLRLTASRIHSNNTSVILQIASGQYEGQKSIGSLAANTLTTEFDYTCIDDNLQYLGTYASGIHTVTYSIFIFEYIGINDVVENIAPKTNYYDYFMAMNTHVIATSGLTRAKCISVYAGQKVKVKANQQSGAQICFLTSLPATLSNSMDLSSYVISSYSVASGEEDTLDVPSDATLMWINVSTYYSNNFMLMEPEELYIYEDASNLLAGFDDISHDANWVKYDGAIFASNGKYAVAAGCAFKYIPVQEGEQYIITTGNSGGLAFFALMRSIPSTIQNNTNIDATLYGSIGRYDSKTVVIDSGCNYLAVSVLNAYSNIEPIFIGRYSEVHDIRHNVAMNSAMFDKNKFDRLLIVPVYGQSLAIGGDATPITTYCRFPNNCANTEDLKSLFNQSLETSIYGLVESFVDFKGQEDRVPAIRQKDFITSFSIGQGSSAISNFVKGTTLYNSLLTKITTSFNRRGGKKAIVPAFCWIQGENDINLGSTSYYNALSQLRTDLDADIKAITGQTEDVHCILYQTNQLCILPNSSFDPSQYSGANMDGSVTAQWELIKDSTYFHASTPVYPLTFVKSSNNAVIHINGMSQKCLGYYEGLAVKRLLDGHGNDIGLYVTSVTKVDATHIRLSLHVPAPPIVIDTESVYAVDNHGFSVINTENQNIISSVVVERNNLGANAILITTNSDCSGAKVRYGVNGTKGYSGFDKGPRGNIRDSQGLWYKAVINGANVPMHNWLYFFEQIVD